MTKLMKTALLTAAVSAVPVLGLAHGAFGQSRIDTGNVLDANNRIGSGGHNPNDSSVRVGEQVNGNDVVTGNVTGGRQFRGHVPYKDPMAFRGKTVGNGIDTFTKGSSSANSNLAQTVQPFYGTGRAVAPPPGYVQADPGSGGYVPSNQIINRPVGDRRIGDLEVGDAPQTPLPSPGELFLPGPVDPQSGQTYIGASPLYGIRQFGANEQAVTGLTSNTQYNPVTNQLDQQSIQRMRDEMNQGLANPSLPGAEVGKQPTNGTGAETTDNNTTGSPTGGAPAGGATNGGMNGGAMKGASGATALPGATPVVQQPLANTTVVQAQPIQTAISATPGEANTQQSVRNRLVVPPPQQQSSVYAELLRRHEQAANNPNLTDEEANRAFAAARKAQPQPGQAAAPGAQPGQPGAGQPGVTGAQPGQPGAQAAAPGALPGPGGVTATPGGTGVTSTPGAVPIPSAPPTAGTTTPPPGGAAAGATTPGGVPDYTKRGQELMEHGVPKPGKQPTVRKAEPVKVPSLAQGVKGKGLGDILKGAEELMKEGKFTSALDQYDKAEQVAPNNPLIKLGRANAELGAAYYARAEDHLRNVLSSNPELLNGQYDLASMLGEQRLQTLVRDLKEIANRDQREARPLFLLAYIAYNTGHEQNAEAYLDLADKRSGGKDQFYTLLRNNWSLPGGATTQPAPSNEMNK